MERSGMIITLLLFLPPKQSFKGSLGEWIDNDGFTDDELADPTKKHLVYELNRLKDEFRRGLSDKESSKGSEGDVLNPEEIYNLIEGNKIRISKIRLAIKPEYAISRNLHRNIDLPKPKSVYYLVARAYWINNKGKKFRKFSKNFGAEDKVLVNGVIPQGMINEVENALTNMMWEEYRMEYDTP